MPCGNGGLVLAAEVAALEGGCVTLEVTQIANAAPVLDAEGDVLLGEGDVSMASACAVAAAASTPICTSFASASAWPRSWDRGTSS